MESWWAMTIISPSCKSSRCNVYKVFLSSHISWGGSSMKKLIMQGKIETTISEKILVDLEILYQTSHLFKDYDVWRTIIQFLHNIANIFERLKSDCIWFLRINSLYTIFNLWNNCFKWFFFWETNLKGDLIVQYRYWRNIRIIHEWPSLKERKL